MASRWDRDDDQSQDLENSWNSSGETPAKRLRRTLRLAISSDEEEEDLEADENLVARWRARRNASKEEDAVESDEDSDVGSVATEVVGRSSVVRGGSRVPRNVELKKSKDNNGEDDDMESDEDSDVGSVATEVVGRKPVLRARVSREVRRKGSKEGNRRGNAMNSDSDSDVGSVATEVVGRSSTAGGAPRVSSLPPAAVLRENSTSPRVSLPGSDDDNDEVELLSLPSDDGNANDDKVKAANVNNDSDITDYDSDETRFDPKSSPPRQREESSSKVNPPRPSSPLVPYKSRYKRSSDEESVASGPQPLIEEPSSDTDDHDPPYKPDDTPASDTDSKMSEASDDNDLDDDDEDFKLPIPSNSKSKSGKSWLDSYSTSDEEDAIPVPKRCRPPSPKKDFSFMDQDDLILLNTPPLYDPTKAHSENWHGDVQRTVAMLEQTMATMPMPNDEESEDMKLPPGLVDLYAHQKYALRWMSWREGHFPGGGILADEMGLGKTIEVIALLMKSKWDATKSGKSLVTTEDARKYNCVPSRTTLVVSPLGCIPQWVREIETKGKNLKVYTYHGSKKTASAVDLSKYDVVITTYQTIAHEIPKLDTTDSTSDNPATPKRRPKVSSRSPLKRVYWVRIVLDEAHQIRNPKTNAAQAIFQLNARFRWAVTGTPIHNRPEDFYSMCTFLRLTPFDDRAIWDYWIGLKTIKRFGGAEKRLHILGKTLILRRTKDEVGLANDAKIQAIPPKTVEVIDVQMGKEERKIYDMLMEYAQGVLKKFLSQKEQREHGLQLGGLMYAADRVQERREDFPEDIRFSHIFALLTRLRQCAVLPHLIQTMIEAEDIGEGEEFDDLKPDHIISKKNPAFDRLYLSSKIQKILEDVDELRSKAAVTGEPMEKVIIVSSWTSTLDILYEHLIAKNYKCVFITGRDDMNIRMDNMDRLNKNKWRPQILLLSLMAGGVGLNLVGANHVFFLEPHWNPQHELQAQDRVHRFGQTKNVFIRRYISEGTIESRIMDLQQQKRELADGLLSNTKKTRGAGISLDQIKTLFDMPSRRGFDEHGDAWYG